MDSSNTTLPLIHGTPGQVTLIDLISTDLQKIKPRHLDAGFELAFTGIHSMVLGLIFLLLVGAGAWSLDAKIWRKKP